MSPDDNDDTELSGLADTPEMRRLLETVSNLTPERARQLLERWGLEAGLVEPTNPPEEPK